MLIVAFIEVNDCYDKNVQVNAKIHVKTMSVLWAME